MRRSGIAAAAASAARHPDCHNWRVIDLPMIAPQHATAASRFYAMLLLAALLASAGATAQTPASRAIAPARSPHCRRRSPQASSKMTASWRKRRRRCSSCRGARGRARRLALDVEEILDESADTAESCARSSPPCKSQIEKLGPPPAKELRPKHRRSPPTRPPHCAGRDSTAPSRRAELTWVRARQLIERITVLRHSLFTKNLLERLPSPLLPGLWRDFITKRRPSGAAALSRRRLVYWGGAGSRHELIAARWPALLLFVVLRVLVAAANAATPGRARAAAHLLRARHLRVRGRRRCGRCPPSRPACCSTAASMPWTCCIQPWGRAAAGHSQGHAGLRRRHGAASPPCWRRREPQWRLCRSADRSARRVAWLLSGITAVYAIDVRHDRDHPRLLRAAGRSASCSRSRPAWRSPRLLIGLLLTPFEPPERSAKPRSARATSPALAQAAACGWSPSASSSRRCSAMWRCARFVAQQLVLTGIVVVLWLARLSGHPRRHARAAARGLSGRRDAGAPVRHSTRRAAISWRG